MRLELQTFQMLVRGSAQTAHVQICFPEQLLGLSCQTWPVNKKCQCEEHAWAISGNENNVQLSSAASNTFERSSRSEDKCASRIEQNSDLETPPDHDLLNKI